MASYLSNLPPKFNTSKTKHIPEPFSFQAQGPLLRHPHWKTSLKPPPPPRHHCRLFGVRSPSTAVSRRSQGWFFRSFEDNVCSPSAGDDDEALLFAEGHRPVKFLFWVLFWASVSIAAFAFSGEAKGAVDSIRAPVFGLGIANALRGSGWADDAIGFALAILPLIELRAAIPVGYWLQLSPASVTVLSVLGNMVPVPFIVLYLKPFATFLAGLNKSASRLIERLFERVKKKACPVEEFQWLGLMLFVSVPFSGTGA